MYRKTTSEMTNNAIMYLFFSMFQSTDKTFLNEAAYYSNTNSTAPGYIFF